MKILLATVGAKRAGKSPAAALTLDYIERATRYADVSLRAFADEAALLDFVARSAARTRPMLWLAESRGDLVTSEELAASLRTAIDAGTQLAVLAIGPPDGWSAAALARADRKLSFGRITLPHELAAAVLAEQTYRALTIHAGHPYHAGH